MREPTNIGKEHIVLFLKEKGHFEDGSVEVFQEALSKKSSRIFFSEATEKILFYTSDFDYHFRIQLPDSEKEVEDE